MALPNDYKSYSFYFDNAVSFLKEHDFLFNHANTEILSRDILKKIPNSWTQQIQNLSNKEIIALSFSKTNYFGGFFEKLERLLLLSRNIVDEVADKTVGKINRQLTSGLSPKKQHEIFALCQKIHEQCLLKNVLHILDLGSGLGYLSQLLYEKHGYNVLGLEANVEFLKIALERQEKFYKTSRENVKFNHLYVKETSETIIQELVQAAFGGRQKFLIVGLHACGDLTINAIKLFLSLDDCEGICVMPCCYHKISLKLANESDHVNSTPVVSNYSIEANYCNRTHNKSEITDNEEISLVDTYSSLSNTNSNSKDNLSQKFDNFPLSDSLKNCFHKFKAEAFLKRPFLRLGCQRPQNSWLDCADSSYQARVFHLLSRAVLELYAFKEDAKLTKTKRRGVRRIESNKLDFSSFLEDAIVRGYILQKDRTEKCSNGTSENNGNEDSNQSSPNTEMQFDRNKILALWNELTKDDFNKALLYTVMQDSLQGLCENIILLDKLAYLQQYEAHVMDFTFIKITDEKISPRCFALVANKCSNTI